MGSINYQFSYYRPFLIKLNSRFKIMEWIFKILGSKLLIFYRFRFTPINSMGGLVLLNKEMFNREYKICKVNPKKDKDMKIYWMMYRLMNPVR